MNAWEFLRGFPFLWSRERFGFATNSEKKRWLQNHAVVINGKKASWDEQLTFPIESVVLFPNGKRVTLF